MFFFQAEDGIRDIGVTGVQTCALPISALASLVLASLARALRQAVPSQPQRPQYASPSSAAYHTPPRSYPSACHTNPHAGHSISDRKSTRLNSSHANISYAVFCLKKKYNRVHTESVYYCLT